MAPTPALPNKAQKAPDPGHWALGIYEKTPRVGHLRKDATSEGSVLFFIFVLRNFMLAYISGLLQLFYYFFGYFG